MKKILSATVMLAVSLPILGQTLLNKEWDTFCASPDTIDIVQTAIDGNGSLVMTGHTKTSNQNNNVLTILRDADGNIIWSQSFNGASNGSDYGTCITFDQFGHIFVAGATYSTASNSYDYLILKYTSTGSLLWSATYNGPGNGYDVVAGIVLDNSGNVYVTGGSKGTGSFANIDYATIKYNASGVQQWVSRYNNISLPDVPCGIARDNNGNIFVAGGSANSIAGSDIYIIKYNSSGTQTASYRHTITSANGWDKATSFVLDNSGNVYVTGNIYSTTVSCDMRTIKLNNALQLQWATSYNGDNKNDCGNSIGVDPSGNVFVCGYSEKQNGGKYYTTIKYSGSGSQQWCRRQASAISTCTADAHKLQVCPSGGVIVTGEMTNCGNKDFLTIRYDAYGTKTWEDYYGTGSADKDRAFDIGVSGSDVYVTGKSQSGSTEQYSVVKYSTMSKSIVPATFSGGTYAKNEIIIRFDPSVLNMTNVDDKDVTFGVVSDFVSQSAIINMNNKLGVDVSKWTLIKVNPWLTSAQTVSVSRQGESVDIPSFWATFIIMPSGIADTVAADSLNRLTPDVWYAELNYLYELHDVPNDLEYALNQGSLHPTSTYPSGNINMESAWDVEKGKQFIKIGVFDSGIDQDHDELSNGKVAGGYDYINSTGLSSPYDTDGHGTRCAGIIGAYRNDGVGVAGIAGGDVQNSNPGITLYNMKISANNNIVLSAAVSALQQGATDVSAGGFELHGFSNSWGGSTSTLSLNNALNYVGANGVVNICSRGNAGNSNATFPACFDDDFIISVGGSGTNGDYHTATNGSPTNNLTSYGVEMDLIAPSVTELVTSTESGTNSTNVFWGTSAAAPHVSGVSALMLSHINQPNPTYTNLSPEDVEHIMQLSALDRTAPPQGVGYDDQSGWGLVDAGNTMSHCGPGYRVHHYSDFTNVTSFSIVPTVVASNATVFLPFNYNNIAQAYYLADVIKVTHTFTFNDILPSEQIIGSWARSTASNGWAQVTPLRSTPHCVASSVTSTQAVLEEYVYHLTYSISGQVAVNYTIPMLPPQTKAALTIYTYDAITIGLDESIVSSSSLIAYPNPVQDQLTIQYTLDRAADLTVEIYDALGNLVMQDAQRNSYAGINVMRLETAEWAEAVYFVRVFGSEFMMETKFTVIH